MTTAIAAAAPDHGKGSRRPKTFRKAEWVSRHAAGLILGITDPTVDKVLAGTSVRVQRLPGLPLRYNRADVEALLSGSISRT